MARDVVTTMMTRVQLLGPAWTRAFRNVWMLEELGIPYKILDDKPLGRRVRSFVKSGKVPVLLEYDNSNKGEEPLFVLYESSSINTYLGDKYGADKKLVPTAGTRERALYDQTVSCITTELDAQGLWIHRKHEPMGKFFGFIPEAVEAGKQNFTRMNEQLAEQLNPYLLGENFHGHGYPIRALLGLVQEHWVACRLAS